MLAVVVIISMVMNVRRPRSGSVRHVLCHMSLECIRALKDNHFPDHDQIEFSVTHSVSGMCIQEAYWLVNCHLL